MAALFTQFLSFVRQLTGVARFRNGTVAEERIDLRIEVEDENDNPPVFMPIPVARVNESSPPGRTLTSVLYYPLNVTECG